MGRPFRSFADRCAAAGITPSLYYARVAAGWSRQAALHTGVWTKRPPAPLHTGAGISLGTYYERLRRGWSKQEALQTPHRQLPERLRQQGVRNRYHRVVTPRGPRAG